MEKARRIGTVVAELVSSSRQELRWEWQVGGMETREEVVLEATRGGRERRRSNCERRGSNNNVLGWIGYGSGWKAKGKSRGVYCIERKQS